MRAVIVNDPHLADRPPSIRTESYASDILTKLAYITEVVQEHRAEAVICTGDLFHLKAASRTSHALVQRTIEVVRSYGVPFFVVPGNHDLQHDRLESLDRQPLGVLFEAEAAIPLVGREHQFGCFFGVPWCQDWKRDLLPYMDEWQESEARLMLAHAPIVRPGETRPFEYIDAADWCELMLRPGDVAHGHMHDADGAYTHDEFVVCNNGALSRGSIHESSLKRVPRITLYDSEALYQQRFLAIDVPHRPAAEVFRLAEKEDADAKQERLDEFLASIGRTSLERISMEHVMKDLTERGTRSEVLEEARECFEAVT